MNNEVIQIMPFRIPSRKLLFLDIEATLRDRMVWLIGFMTEYGFKQLYADDREQERDILTEFLRAMIRYRGHMIVAWTRFDTHFLQSRMRMYELKCNPLSSMSCLYLRHQLLKSYIFPTHGTGLKKVGISIDSYSP